MRYNQRIPPVPRTSVLPRPGEVIKYKGIRYQIGEQIGCGRFGVVFDCRNQWGTELVAKVLWPRNRPYETIRSEWLNEFKKLRLLQHPNVVRIYQAFECRDTFYLIFEKCLCTLKDWTSNFNINGDLWLPDVSHDVLNGLRHIHDHGYVHKDLHPGNIFVSEQRDPTAPDKPPIWRFKIGDLGISRREVDIRFNTILAQWMLPPEYLMPQDFGAPGGRIDKRIDIYHVGLLLVSLLLNQTPNFTLADIITGQPRKLAERLSSRYAAAIARALRRHVIYRTPSAIDMWREIQLAQWFNCSPN